MGNSNTIVPYILLLYLINTKRIAVYEVTNGSHCGGESINIWADGSNAAYKDLNIIPNCTTMCDMHAECSGFVHQTSDGICSFWQRGTLNLYSSIGHNCHKKLKGTVCVDMKY